MSPWEGSDASAPSQVQVDSATIYLLKKAASGIPRAANTLWSIIQDMEFDEQISGVIEASQALRCTDELGEDTSPEADAQGNDDPPEASDTSDASSCEQNANNEGGLLFQSAELNDDGSERLDYVITQVDISRMARAASKQLDVRDVHQLPQIIYSEKTRSICSSHQDEDEDEDVDQFLLRNRGLIEDYFDNNGNDGTAQNQRPAPTELGLSWMIVPDEPPHDELVRLPDPAPAKVPGSISICKSADSLSVEGDRHDDETFEHCVICGEHFADGDQLRVLPCQHRFHSGCIDKWLSSEVPSDCCIVSGCPTCKRQASKASIQDESEVTQPTRNRGGRRPNESSPRWAFGLSTLIPGLNS